MSKNSKISQATSLSELVPVQEQTSQLEHVQPTTRRKFLVSSVSSDSHTWNLVFLQLLIEEHGHQVINLGSCIPQEFLVEQCLLHKPDVLVISSVNGHGHIEGTQLMHAIRQIPELQRLTTVIGGKLGTRGTDNAMYTAGLLEAGFDAVFDADSSIPAFVKLLEAPINSPAKECLQ